jgi:hypothetical protein
MPPKQKQDRTYGGAATAAGGAALATSTPVLARADRAYAEHRRRKIDTKIEDLQRKNPSAGARRGLPKQKFTTHNVNLHPSEQGGSGGTLKVRHPVASKAPSAEKLKLRRSAPPGAEQAAKHRAARKAAYRTIHELRADRKLIKPELSTRSLRANLVAAGVGVPLSYLGARHQLKVNQVSKAQKDNNDQKKLAAGYGGAAAGAGLYQGAGYSMIPKEKGWQKAIASNPAHKAALDAHRKKHIGPDTHKNDPKYRQFFREYPKHLPGGKARRIMSWTHTGKTGTALTLGAAGLTAAGAYKATDLATKHKKPVAKNHSVSAFGVEH